MIHGTSWDIMGHHGIIWDPWAHPPKFGKSWRHPRLSVLVKAAVPLVTQWPQIPVDVDSMLFTSMCRGAKKMGMGQTFGG